MDSAIWLGAQAATPVGVAIGVAARQANPIPLPQTGGSPCSL
jgi:hypothetical protein